MIFINIVVIVVVLIGVWRGIVSPHLYLKKMEDENNINKDQYCLIDIRDFTSYHRNPTAESKNIPLSYLPREMRNENQFDKDVVIIADGRRAAKMAARIINKHSKKQVYYITI